MRRPTAMRPDVAGAAAAVGAVLGWGLGPVLVKFIELPGLAVSFHRLWIGAVVGTALLYARGGRFTLRSLRLAAPGGVAFGLDIALFFVAVKRTTVADATVISALQPALVFLVVGRLFGEKVEAVDVAWTAVAIGGVGVVVYAGADVAGRSLTGDLLSVGALFAWAWYFVASKRARETLGALEYQAALGVVAAVVVSPIALGSGARLAVPDAGTWGWLLVMVMVPGGGHFLMNWAHEHVPLTVTSLLTLSTPVTAAIGAALFLDEPILALQLVGMAIVLAALGIVVWRRSRAAHALALMP